MTRERLMQLIETYGSDWRRWPEGERYEALALLSRSQDVLAVLEQAQRLDDTLDQSRPQPAGEWLKQSIVFSAQATAQEPAQETVGRKHRILQFEWTKVAVLAGIFVLGLAMSLSDFSIFQKPVTRVDVSYLLQDSSFVEGWMP